MPTSSSPTLYHAPFACSLGVKLAARWVGLDLKTEPLHLTSKRLLNGGDYRDIHPLGQVAALRWPDGTIFTETSTCLAWVQSQSGPLPESDYFQVLRWLGFCATELHKQGLRIIFYDEATDAVKTRFRALAESRLDHLGQHLSDRAFLIGDTRSAADAYLTWFLTLSERAGIATDAVASYRDRMLADSALQACLAEDAQLKTDLTDLAL